jgi:hypothetical protein
MCPSSLTPEDIATGRRLLAEATPGEWRAGRADMVSSDFSGEGCWKSVYVDDDRAGIHKPTGEKLPLTVAKGISEPGDSDEAIANAQLIAWARNNLPRLLDGLERYQGGALDAMIEAHKQELAARHKAQAEADALRARVERLEPFASLARIISLRMRDRIDYSVALVALVEISDALAPSPGEPSQLDGRSVQGVQKEKKP